MRLTCFQALKGVRPGVFIVNGVIVKNNLRINNGILFIFLHIRKEFKIFNEEAIYMILKLVLL